ncbi:MAG TPA: SUMF1/EgtB/PvdO family nonheme iron enzyme [Candidatus Hydrogenedentes bacterium]|nr:SUMF1/EgtB/PvdO family nonheme iron enzyme [Candidatus Hydrogenedentota bacterium]HPG65833.1 SUMF1/EgtB/PvdO family nonheme iron enzyme [Candidatus Hydrogenedentota bacterium]
MKYGIGAAVALVALYLCSSLGGCPTPAEGEGEGEGEGVPEGLVVIAEGWFQMGALERETGSADEYPTHFIYLDEYQIGQYEVTNAEFVGVLNWALEQGDLESSSGTDYAGQDVYAFGKMMLDLNHAQCPIVFTDNVFSVRIREDAAMDNHPVVLVTWYGAVAYCNWRSRMEGLKPVYNLETWERIKPAPNGYRLPTEAEWERAAAWGPELDWIAMPDGTAGGHYIYAIQSDTVDTSRANYIKANPADLDANPLTSPVGFFEAQMSPSGCYDMTGNAIEWCGDWYGAYEAASHGNYQGPPTGSKRVARGGGWNSDSYTVRASARDSYGENTAQIYIGFRVARTP